MQPFVKSRKKILAGVIGGAAERWGWEVTFARLAYAALTLLTGTFPGVILYIIAAIVVPEPNNDHVQDITDDSDIR